MSAGRRDGEERRRLAAPREIFARPRPDEGRPSLTPRSLVVLVAESELPARRRTRRAWRRVVPPREGRVTEPPAGLLRPVREERVSTRVRSLRYFGLHCPVGGKERPRGRRISGRRLTCTCSACSVASSAKTSSSSCADIRLESIALTSCGAQRKAARQSRSCGRSVRAGKDSPPGMRSLPGCRP